MLFLVGLGLDTKDLSVLALDEAKKADTLFLETYTAFLPAGYPEFIEEQTRKRLQTLKRKDLEDNVKQTVALAKDRNVVILVPGDPLIATTHGILLNEARKQGIRCRVIHAPSVFSTAIGESGLDVYKFGPTVTVPFWSDKYKPTAFLDSISRNLSNGQHTLILLDITQEDLRPMKIEEATEIITDALSASGVHEINAGTEVIVLANLGRADQTIRRTKLEEMHSLAQELSGKVLSLIIPGKLSFAEEESLSSAVSNA